MAEIFRDTTDSSYAFVFVVANSLFHMKMNEKYNFCCE